MFNGCTNVGVHMGDIGDWDVTNVTDASYMFNAVNMGTANYNDLLNGWAAQAVENGVAFHAGSTKYGASAATARAHLVDTHGWTITDGGAE
jgi:hypothetical protein